MRKTSRNSPIATIVWIMMTLFRSLVAQTLDLTDVKALQDVKNSLHDLPGSTFFASWDFSFDPCESFSGVVCESVGSVRHVVMLSLGNGFGNSPGLAGVLTPSLGSLNFLKMLTIAPGQVQGIIPESLGGLPLLEFLGIGRNRLSGPIPESFANLQNLQGLDLGHNELSGTIPAVIGALPKLNTLALSHNNIIGQIPSFSAPLIHLDLEQNILSGSLPRLSQSLVYLSLSMNSLTGSLESLAYLQNLRYLDLSFNQFKGNIPPEIFGFELSNMYLQRNQLSGVLAPKGPVSIGSVDLSYNLLTGTLPSWFVFTNNLFLNNNKLTGVVPQGFFVSMLLGHLQNLYLQHNYFEDMEMGSNIPLPVTCTFCIQYNCLIPSKQSSCPLNTGIQASRPASECNFRH
ncbi:hypothetical protein O6H91_05G123600 [Diphasiastrum complanatum]|nr:hypothetical protein O6H91_05G123600 [Diphasiastrum complanatum]